MIGDLQDGIRAGGQRAGERQNGDDAADISPPGWQSARHLAGGRLRHVRGKWSASERVPGECRRHRAADHAGEKQHRAHPPVSTRRAAYVKDACLYLRPQGVAIVPQNFVTG